MIISVLVWINAKDTPESEGLPPIDEYRNDYENLEKQIMLTRCHQKKF